MTARLADQLADRILAMTMICDERFIALGFLDRVQILPLDILDQRDLGHRRIAVVADQRRDRMNLRPLRRSPATLAGDDLETVTDAAHQDRLDHAMLGDRFGKLVEAILVEMLARLQGVGANPRNGDRLDSVAATFDICGGGTRCLAEQRA